MNSSSQVLGVGDLGYKGLSRLAVIDNLKEASSQARAATRQHDDQYRDRGDATASAGRVGDALNEAVRLAIVAERISGTDWSVIGAQLGVNADHAERAYEADVERFQTSVAFSGLTNSRVPDLEGISDPATTVYFVHEFLDDGPNSWAADMMPPPPRDAKLVSDGVLPNDYPSAGTGASDSVARAARLLSDLLVRDRRGRSLVDPPAFGGPEFPPGTDRNEVEYGLNALKLQQAELYAEQLHRPADINQVTTLRERLAEARGIDVSEVTTPAPIELPWRSFAKLNVSIAAREVSDAARAAVIALTESDVAPGQILEAARAAQRSHNELRIASTVLDRMAGDSWEALAPEQETRLTEWERAEIDVARAAMETEIVRAQLTTVGAKIGGPEIERRYIEPIAVADELDRWTRFEHAYPDTPAWEVKRDLLSSLKSNPAELAVDLQRAATLVGGAIFAKTLPDGCSTQTARAEQRALQSQVEEILGLTGPETLDRGGMDHGPGLTLT